MFESFVIPALAFHLAVIAPAFQDLVPENPYQDTAGEWTLMDNVVTKRPIIDIKRIKNILQRRDASCDLNYKKVMGAGVRSITTDELYAATSMCKHEFYQGALKEFRNNDPLFGQKILPYFQQAVRTDMLSNAYFGDINRPDTGGEWSTNKYDGIFKWIRTYTAAGVIPASQTMGLAQTDLRANPAAAYAIVKGLYDRQNVLMRNMAPTEKAYYVSQSVADGYDAYLISLGNGDANTFSMYANGVQIMSYFKVPIFPEPCWEPIMTELYNGSGYNAAILTLRGNFVFGTDKEYGEGENLNEALMVWYERRKLAWFYQTFLKAGTQIALPEHLVYAFPNG